MSIFGIKRMLDQKFNPPQLPTTSLAGLTILLTGSSSGLGFEAAKKIAALGAEKLIITTRNESKGQETKKKIEEFVASSKSGATGSGKPTEIIPLTLEMGSFEGVLAFVKSLKTKFSSIDGAILNAGVMQTKYVESSDGWEETLQVNTLSTILLALELLPLLLASAETGKKDYKPHLTIVSSGTAWLVKPEKAQEFMDSETPLEAFSAPAAFPPGLMGPSAVYSRSKLVLEYAVRHFAANPELKGPDGKPKVIINTTCPGLCQSDLSRHSATNPFMKFLIWLIFSVIARSASDGANAYLSALAQGDETHGEQWKNDRVFETSVMVSSPEGRAFGDRVWAEVSQVMLKADPSTKVFV